MKQFAFGNNANFLIQSLFIDLSVNRRLNGQQFPASGDWLYLDEGSSGAVRVELGGTFDNSNTFLLVPGKVIKQAFRQITVFNAPVQTIQTDSNAALLTRPSAKIFYGSGPCPFETSADAARQSGSVFDTSSAFVSQSPTLVRYNFLVTEGQAMDIYCYPSQTAGAGNSSRLRASCNITLGNGGAGGVVLPDNAVIDDVAAGAATARAQFTFRQVVIPRDGTLLTVNIVNNGTEAANNIFVPAVSVIAR